MHRAQLHLGPKAPCERDMQLPEATSGGDRLHPLQPPVGEWLICEKSSLLSCSPLCVKPVQTCCCYTAFPCLMNVILFNPLCAVLDNSLQECCERCWKPTHLLQVCRLTPWLWMCCANLLCGLHCQQGPEFYCWHVNGCRSWPIPGVSMGSMCEWVSTCVPPCHLKWELQLLDPVMAWSCDGTFLI